VKNSSGRLKETVTKTSRNAALAAKVALSCRILAKLGLVKETTGHVSARNGNNHMLIRGRGPNESGLLFTKPNDILLADLEGQSLERRIGLKPPNEAVIHGEIYKARPEVTCVVHAHPPAVVLSSMAGIELRPIYCGYDPSSMRLSLKGIPVYPHTLTLNTKDQVHAMQKIMGASDVCILRGHGLITVGSTLEQATITAIKVDTLARMNLQAASLGKIPAIPEEDIEEFQKRTGRGNTSPEGLWRYYSEWLKKG
jgi:ribulose-5-phosphate 4-epimerase/fuculose-1-phosphate aldolase